MKNILLYTVLIASISGVSLAESPVPQAADHKSEKHVRTNKKYESITKLPQDKRELYKKAMQKEHELNKRRLVQLKEIRKEMKTLMTAATFNKKAYLAKAEEAAKIKNASFYSKAEAIASIADQFSADERKALADLETNRKNIKNNSDKTSEKSSQN